MNVGFQIPNKVKCCTYVAPQINKGFKKKYLKAFIYWGNISKSKSTYARIFFTRDSFHAHNLGEM
jgi:hypothetical protein